MSVCEICGKSKDTSKSLTVYTARAFGQTKAKTGFKTYTFTTQFGDFREHHYDVCKTCSSRRGCLFPLVVFVALTALLAWIFGIRNSTSFGMAMAYVGGALVAAAIPAGFVWVNFDVERTLVRRAVATRKATNPSHKLKGYTAQEYKALKKS